MLNICVELQNTFKCCSTPPVTGRMMPCGQ